MHTDSILEQWNIQEKSNDIVNLCPDPLQLLVLGQAIDSIYLQNRRYILSMVKPSGGGTEIRSGAGGLA